MNYRIVLNLMGRIMIVEALFMLPPLAIAVYCGEWLAVRGFLIAVALLAAVAAWWTRGGSPRGMDAREGFVTVGLVWLVVSLFGAIPFYASGAIPSYIDCVFETVSGFTTTGSSILTDVEALPLHIGSAAWGCWSFCWRSPPRATMAATRCICCALKAPVPRSISLFRVCIRRPRFFMASMSS